MRCAELREALSAYVDGQTAPAETQAIEHHLARCTGCRAAFRRQQQTRRLLKLGAGSTANWTPPDLRLRVQHALHRPAAPRAPRRMAPLLAIVAMLALALGMLAGQSLLAQPSAAPAITPSAPLSAPHRVGSRPAQRRPVRVVLARHVATVCCLPSERRAAARLIHEHVLNSNHVVADPTFGALTTTASLGVSGAAPAHGGFTAIAV